MPARAQLKTVTVIVIVARTLLLALTAVRLSGEPSVERIVKHSVAEAHSGPPSLMSGSGRSTLQFLHKQGHFQPFVPLLLRIIHTLCC
jgi:hypothetical protein